MNSVKKGRKIVSTIEARMASTRLPGKVLKPALEKPLLGLLIERLKRVKLIDEIVVATTVNDKDDIIESFCDSINVKCFRGSEEDVLKRVLDAAKSVNAELIVEITGDCPLIDPHITRECIKLFLSGEYDYVSNGCLEKTFPDGLGVQVFPVSVLEEVNKLTKDPVDHEHVSLYIYKHPEKYRLKNYKAEGELRWPELSITLDTPQDYQLIKRIYEELYPCDNNFTAYDVIRFIKENPDLININKDDARSTDYIKSMPRKARNE